ncbi:MAG: thioredoxin family protein [Anaerosolibacter sp.]|jgi:small redox-active disulfide protein 2|uniref:thioredoxin family protein n=1 Tax=Anaerosolibacter sp. TaxID=1872527 RepID=UPI0026284ABA|nr:thioredoxin family protein [Anaerosolibacter sp.]MDF2547817.1 thioredoxin family protein [Anaerosolibacter sp.]
MNIKILGPGCKNCTTLYEYVSDVVTELGIQAEIEKVTDFKEIVTMGVMKTPGLVVNGTVKVSGRIPSKEEIKEILNK